MTCWTTARAKSCSARASATISDGKITLPIVLAFQRGDATERRFWRRTLEQGEQREGDLAHRPPGAARRSRRQLTRAGEFSAAAQRDLERFPPTLARQAMLDLADFCVERAY